MVGPLDAFLLRSTLLLLIGYAVVWTSLKLFRITSPRLHRAAWFAVLLLGCCGAGFNIEIPVLNQPTSCDLRSQTVDVASAGGQPTAGRLRAPYFQNIGRTEGCSPVPSPEYRTLPPGGRQPTFPWITVSWLSGVVFVLLRWTYRYTSFRKLLKAASPPPADWLADWHAVAGGKIPMLVADAAGPALVRTLFGYRLVVPAEYWLNIKPVLRASVLRHEFAHYRRRDALKSLVVRLLALPQWFNPCAWSAVKRFDDAAEWACDEAACGGSDDAVAEFAEALVALHESLRGSRRSRLFSGFASRAPSARIRRLVLVHHHQTLKDSLMKKTTVLTVCALLLLGGLFQFRLVAQTEKAEKVAPELPKPADPMAPSFPASSFAAPPMASPKKEENKPQVPWSSPSANPLLANPPNSDTWVKYKINSQGAAVQTNDKLIVPQDSKLQIVEGSSKSPDVGKFRIPIEYKLKNIPAASLKEFLTEQFKDSTVEVAEPATRSDNDKLVDVITITASLEDHKAIKKMLVEIEREVETLKNDAADAEVKQVSVLTIKDGFYETLKSKPETVRREIEALTVGYDASNHWLIAKGTKSELEKLKTILQELDAFPPVLRITPHPDLGEPKPEAAKEKE